MVKVKIKEYLSVILAASMAFPPTTFAAQVEIGKNMNLRISGTDSRNGSILKTLTTLPRGSVIEIPDEYVVMSGPKINVNASLNKWISHNRMAPSRFDANGKSKFDYFFRVKVVSTPNKDFNGQYGYVALGALAVEDGMKIKTIQDTALIDSRSFDQPTYRPPSQTPSTYSAPIRDRTEAKVCIDNCDQDNHLISRIKSELSRTLVSIQNRTNQFMRGKSTDGTFNAIIRNFERSCYGLKFDDFANYVKAESPRQNVPAETMLSIMTQESAGSCGAIGDRTSSSKSVGLFQINTQTITNINPCTNRQFAALRGKTIEQMETDPSLLCLQNPVVNFHAGIKVLKDKYALVNGGAKPMSNGTWDQLSTRERDNFRKALSAYNGGQRWVLNAQSDMRYASEKFGIALNDDWETIRLFFFRHELKRNGYVQAQGPNRATRNNLINVPYVESIMGRESTSGATQSGYTQRWAQVLYTDRSNYVASRE